MRIKLTQSKFAVVDKIDYVYLKQWKWYHHCGYARNDWFEENRHRIFMHTVISERMSLRGLIDHIDGNGLNNRRSNLRPATSSQNKCNSGKYKNNTSGFKGVFWRANRRVWIAQITVDGKQIYLGYFKDKLEAAKTYNEAAKKYHGEFARLNKI